MSVAAEDESLGHGLEFDLWEGQFEFVGGGDLAGGQQYTAPRRHPHRANGCRKSEAQLWCEDIALHVQMLQQQMSVLADNQTNSDERYTRAKQDNATLQARVVMLEEQLREVELRSEERLAEEQRRHRELVARVDREKQLQVENCAIRLQTLELENSSLREEATRCRGQVERLRAERQDAEEQLGVATGNLATLQEELAALQEQERLHGERERASQQLVEELSGEVERLRQAESSAVAALRSHTCEARSSTLQQQLDALKEEHNSLLETHEELQSLLLNRSVEEGRNLLTGNRSLAAELEAMTHDDGEIARDNLKTLTALKEQQEVNDQLRSYIDQVLLNIVENYPQLLEVKRSSSST